MGVPRPPDANVPNAGFPALPPLLLALFVLALAACGYPKPGETVGVVDNPGAPVPAGAHLYCITNIGHTLVAYSLAERRVLPETARYLDLDPVGPWFTGGHGYYISRVEGSGAGSNALIRFDPKTKVETGRLKFPALSNPNSFFPVPGFPNLAWVALRGSNLGNFNTNGLSVVDLTTLRDIAYCDLNSIDPPCAWLVPSQGGVALTSLLGFFHDPTGCGGGGCVYGVVNNWNGVVRDGWLIVWSIDALGKPVFEDAIPLGRNPQHPPLMDSTGRLWVVNNGGYVHYDANGQAGTLQVLDPTLFATGTAGDGTVNTLAIEDLDLCGTRPRPDNGCDPTGLFSLDGATAWLTTYPDDRLREVNLGTDTVAAYTPTAAVTGPLFPAEGGTSVFAAYGGYGLAGLGEFDMATGTLTSPTNLGAGFGPVTCAEHTVL